MKKVILMTMMAGFCALSHAESVVVGQFNYSGPYEVLQPFVVDSLDVNSKTFEAKTVVENLIKTDKQSKVIKSGAVPGSKKGNAVHKLQFSFTNSGFTKASIDVKGLKSEHRMFLDGNKLEGKDLVLEPSSHEVVIQYLSTPDVKDTVEVTIESKEGAGIVLNGNAGRLYTLDDVLHGKRFTGTEVSPDGKYLINSYRITRKGGATSSKCMVVELATGNVCGYYDTPVAWMPRTNKYYFTEQGVDSRRIITVDPVTGRHKIFADNIPEGHFVISPDETYLLYTVVSEGPKEDSGVYEILNPEDRQNGWRNRGSVAKYDLATGIMQPVTFGHRNVFASDISSDGKSILLLVQEHRFTKRPTTLFSLYKVDAQTLEPEIIVDKDGFIGAASFSPDGKEILISGSPEALGGVGNAVPEGNIPSLVDNQLFIMTLKDKKVRPVTRDFDPCVQRAVWSKADGNIYFTAEDKDSINLFCLNPATEVIRQLPVPEEVINSFSVSENSPIVAAYGVSTTNSDRLYVYDTVSGKCSLQEDLSAEILDGIKLGECNSWTFDNGRGDKIHCRYILPPDFDSEKSYPMIVNYYGGCSPTSRLFESRYPHHAYAAQGYVVLVIQPSGATGFGQEFSSRHVNTAGQGVAEDIIQGTVKFCEEHPWVNSNKIGCIGASYGGFMTQYLQTVTDLFAAAISHAGISDHTSYWGEGYWGYSYSEVSMADSYPWTRKDLFVDQSPLFNAEKIHTPLLFVHGDSDVNVPFSESIQMFTALKLLGRETAFVAVSGEDHHILDYDKRKKWQNTIYAWFAKWLKDDPTWWNHMYPEKAL